jgi:peptide/nickel transport system permease protein
VRSIARNLPGLIGLGLLAVSLLAAAAPQLFTPYPPDLQEVANRLQPTAWSPDGSAAHPLGTDQLGRDMLSRLAYGGRTSLLIGAVSVALTGPLGLCLGILSGYLGGRVESVVMGIVDIILALPFVLVAIFLAALIGPGLLNVLIILTVSGWVVFTRVTHSQTLGLKASEFIEAARAIGASDARILWRHVLPHTIGPFLVVATLQVGRMMLAEAALSFLGLGVEPGRPTWGTMLGDSRAYILTAPWLVTFPGLAITVIVLATNLVGDWMRALLEPRRRPPQAW